MTLVSIHPRKNSVDHLSACCFGSFLVRLTCAGHVDAILGPYGGKQRCFVNFAVDADY